LNLKTKSDDLRVQASKMEQVASEKNFKSDASNQTAIKLIDQYRKALRETKSAKKKTEVKPYNQVGYLVLLGLAIEAFFGVGWKFIGGRFWPFLKGFWLVFPLSELAFFCASQVEIKTLGIGYAAWAIALGLTVANAIGTPIWVKPALQVEYYIKTGLVLLGAEILFGKVLSIGIPGIFVAWVVTPVVLLTTYWFGQKVLRMTSKSLNITICADMSVCGVSAAIATAAACKAKKEELTLVIGLSLIFTSIIMPNFIKAIGMDPILGGAWMGGNY
jgi:hypothetical protein